MTPCINTFQNNCQTHCERIVIQYTHVNAYTGIKRHAGILQYIGEPILIFVRFQYWNE